MAKQITTPALPLNDRCFNKGLDHGALAGVVTKQAAQASIAHLKRGAGATTNYGSGFFQGFALGFKAV